MCRVSSGLRVVWSVGGLRRRLVPSLSNAEGWDWMRSVFTGMHAGTVAVRRSGDVRARLCEGEGDGSGRIRRLRRSCFVAAVCWLCRCPLCLMRMSERQRHTTAMRLLVRPRRQRRTPLGMPAATAPTGVQHQNTRKTETQQIELHSKCALTEGASERRMRHKKKKRKKKQQRTAPLFRPIEPTSSFASWKNR